MRFTDKKGIKIYCSVSFSPCKVWIKCHTLACELLNELVCSPRCGACKYPSWVWNGDCLVGRGGDWRHHKSCRTYLRVALAIRPQQGTGVPNSSIDWLGPAGVPHLKVADGNAPWRLWHLLISGKSDDWQALPKWDEWHALSEWIHSWAGVTGKEYVCTSIQECG